MKPATLLNLAAIIILGTGGLLSLFPSLMVPPELAGLMWGGLVAWLASAKLNGTSSPSP